MLTAVLGNIWQYHLDDAQIFGKRMILLDFLGVLVALETPPRESIGLTHPSGIPHSRQLQEAVFLSNRVPE